MLDIQQIESFYPEYLKPFKRNLLREYLQFKILETVYGSDWGQKLVIMGGTAIHIFHGNPRFSEDLDFDNLGLNKLQFGFLISSVLTSLRRNGYKLESRNVLRTVFRSYLKFSDILYESKISKHRHEKLNIQIDTEPQGFEYEPEKIILNKFDVFMRIQVVPPDILLAQKLNCLFSRPRLMGRNFYDAIFLFAKTKPNMDYLREKIGVKNHKDLISKILDRCQNVEFKKLARDVEPFLYDPQSADKVLHFPEFIKTVKI